MKESEAQYTFGYESAATKDFHASRTVEIQGKFFLPYIGSGMSLLDCGCGSGGITRGLSKIVSPGKVVGVDIGESEIESARELSEGDEFSNLSFEVGSLYELPFQDSEFDALFSHNVLEHLERPEDALREMKRVLKPGGVIGIRDVDFDGWVIGGPLAELLHKGLETIVEDWRQNGGNAQIGKHLRKLLQDSGFVRVVATASYDSYATIESTTWFGEITASVFEEIDFRARVIERGLASPDDLKNFSNAWREWGNHPDAFFGHGHCEVVGWKE